MDRTILVIANEFLTTAFRLAVTTDQTILNGMWRAAFNARDENYLHLRSRNRCEQTCRAGLILTLHDILLELITISSSSLHPDQPRVTDQGESNGGETMRSAHIAPSDGALTPIHPSFKCQLIIRDPMGH